MPLLNRLRDLLHRRDDAAEIADDERANYPEAVSVDSAKRDTIAFLAETDCRIIAEIGIYRGHTSWEIARWLNNEGELHLFDFHDKVDSVGRELSEAGYRNIRSFPNSYKLLDSYNWPLAKLLYEHKEPIYDYVFIDGAHTWAVDALATLLLDRLLKPGGYLDLDDYWWTIAGSPSLNPSVFPLSGKMYTEEQMKECQVRMIADLLLRRDERYAEIVPNKIFQKTRAYR